MKISVIQISCAILLVLIASISFAMLSEQKIVASNGAAGFGGGVVSGSYAIVGVSGDNDKGTNSGAAYIYHFDGTNWVELKKLTASDGKAYALFGARVSISGSSAIVSAWGDGSDPGSAYMYHFDGTNWVELQKLGASGGAVGDSFGCEVSLFGNYAIVGALGDDDNGTNSGAAYIYHFDGTNWVEEQKLTAGDGAADDRFGAGVSIFGNYAIVGALGDDDNGTDSGSAYIYHFDGINWVEQQKLTASDGEAYDHLGMGPGVSIFGNYAIVGAYGDDDNGADSGSAYIYHFDGINWVEQQKLIASDGEASGNFGVAVSLSGSYAIIGAPGEGSDGNGYAYGAAYIYHFDGTNWGEEQKLTASDGEASDYFGIPVSLSGSYAFIGAEGDSGWLGSEYFFGSLFPEGDNDADGIGNNSDICPDNMPLRMNGGIDNWWDLQTVYSFFMADSDIVQTQGGLVYGSLVMNMAKDVTIQGGFDCSFTNNSGEPTVIESLTIDTQSGPVTIDNISIE